MDQSRLKTSITNSNNSETLVLFSARLDDKLLVFSKATVFSYENTVYISDHDSSRIINYIKATTAENLLCMDTAFA